MSNSFYDISVKKIDGSATSLREFEGYVLLVVNVASKCGLTPQYAGLEALFAKYKGRKFAILGFPANDFAGQEPGTDAEIQSFCSLTYDVSFPMFSKIAVTGESKHPLYAHLIAEQPVTEERSSVETMLRGHKIEPTAAPEVVWNFEKFLIDRSGKVAHRFAPGIAPDAAVVASAIEVELAK